MNSLRRIGLVWLILIACCGQETSRGEDTVTISKSRLTQLERQAAEAESLKAALAAAEAELARLRNRNALSQPVTSPNPSPAAKVNLPVPPPLSLAPIQPGEVVLATDLMSHYRTDAVAADSQYKGRKFKVQGEVIRLEKPLLVNNYTVVARTPDPRDAVVFDIEPPREFQAIYTVNHGEAMVGKTSAGYVKLLLKLGQRIVVEGRCKGLRGSVVLFGGCALLKINGSVAN